MGGFATAICMMYLGGKLPTPLLFLTMFLTSVIAGAVWSFVPAFFKANWNTNETLFTLMMNYVAIQLVSYYTNIWRGQASSLGTINMGTKIGWFPKLFGHDFTLNIIIVAVLTVLMYVYLKYTKHGYEISVVGESEKTAKYAGINVKKVTIRTLILSGAICGLCGFIHRCRKQAHHRDKHSRRKRIHRDNSCVALEVQYVLHGINRLPARVP